MWLAVAVCHSLSRERDSKWEPPPPGVFLRTPGGLTETSPEVFGKDPMV